jgi:membrane-associated protease RseP (regulator of RpoE activity)
MEKKKIEIELDKKTNPWKWIALILIGLFVIDVSCSLGAWMGGVAGFALGRKSAREFRIMEYNHEFPLIPEIPDYPRMPFFPTPPAQPRFDIPLIPEIGGRPRLGVTFVTTDEGAEVVAVTPGSPAEQVGIQIGDIITRVNGKRVTRAQPLNELIMQYKPGDVVSLTILRDGQTRQIEVKLAAEPLG